MKEIHYIKLKEQIDSFCEKRETGTSIVDAKSKELLNSLLTAWFADQENETAYYSYLEQLRIACECSRNVFGEVLGDTGLEKYQNNEHKCAQWIYKLALRYSDREGLRNNLAYICRRHGEKTKTAWIEIIDLLLDGVRSMDTFCLVNMALLFALDLGLEADWKTADQLIALIERTKPDKFAAYSWWKELADQGDPEGCLICLWMNHHKIHTGQSNEELSKMRRIVYRTYPSMPEWLL